jgi:hypothetical protein
MPDIDPRERDEDPGRAALRPLPIDLDELIVALTWRSPMLDDSGHWLDLETGALVYVFEDVGIEDFDEDPRDNDRYIAVEPIESHRAFRIMEDFVGQLADAGLARRLDHALRQHKPFRRFKDVLADHPVQRDDWFSFEHDALERHAREWCESRGIAPQWVSPQAR